MDEIIKFKKIWEELKDLNMGEENRVMACCSILKEIGKNHRTNIIKKNEPTDDEPTEKQKNLMDKLDIPYTEKTTKMGASKLISDRLGKK